MMALSAAFSRSLPTAPWVGGRPLATAALFAALVAAPFLAMVAFAVRRVARFGYLTARVGSAFTASSKAGLRLAICVRTATNATPSWTALYLSQSVEAFRMIAHCEAESNVETTSA